ncbi:MAG: hypothetical protein FJZ96_00040 [Chloroflexi bacterium]|nr:hypothetical protein [Chloroflexota bacterium]
MKNTLLRNSLVAALSSLFLLAACLPVPPSTPSPFATPAPSSTPAPLPGLPLVHSTPRFQVFIISPLTACLVGNEFASGNVCAGTECGDCDCAWEDHDPPAPQVGIPPDRLDDPQYNAYAHKICVDVTLTDEEIQDIIADMELVKEQAYEWTGGALDLQMEYTVLAHTFTGFTAPDFVIGPFEIDDDLLDAYVATDTDFVYVVSGVYDRAQGLQLAYWCGGSYGEMGIRGAGYSYVQYNHDVCASVTIAGETVYEPLIHEWIHNLDWALYYINGVPDLYQDTGPDWVNWNHASWPACGTGSSNPLDWFPSIDFCEWDPDWLDCNSATATIDCHSGETGGEISWYEHVLSAHYPRHVQFNGNTCRDGKQDFTETGVDSGWPCP